MKKSILATFILILMSSVAYGQMMEVKEAIKAKEKAIYEAIKKGDMEVFKQSTSDDLLAVYSSGYFNKSEEIENLSKIKMDSYELSDFKFLHPSDDVTIVAYTVTTSGMNDGEKFSGKYHSTSTWMKSGDKWKAVMHTQVKAAPMEEAMQTETDG